MKLFNEISLNKAQIALKETEQDVKFATRTLKESCIKTFRRLWYNPEVPAGEILKEMGDSASSAFSFHEKAVTLLMSLGETFDPIDYIPPLQYTKHEDGTITLNS